MGGALHRNSYRRNLEIRYPGVILPLTSIRISSIPTILFSISNRGHAGITRLSRGGLKSIFFDAYVKLDLSKSDTSLKNLNSLIVCAGLAIPFCTHAN